MNNKGFSMIEMLAVLIIIGLLIIIGVPAYMNVYVSARRNNYHNRIKEVELAAEKYASARKDAIKETYDNSNGTSCDYVTVSDLIIAGYLPSDGNDGDYITNPTTMQPMSGFVYICYSYSTYDVKAYYAEEFKKNKRYYHGEKVYVTAGSTTNIYSVDHDYDGSKTCEPHKGDSLHPMNPEAPIEELQNCGRIHGGTGRIIDVSEKFFKKLNVSSEESNNTDNSPS